MMLTELTHSQDDLAVNQAKIARVGRNVNRGEATDEAVEK
jgi:hypothetical protein